MISKSWQSCVFVNVIELIDRSILDGVECNSCLATISRVNVYCFIF